MFPAPDGTYDLFIEDLGNGVVSYRGAFDRHARGLGCAGNPWHTTNLVTALAAVDHHWFAN